jgi:single-strand DNA-binding protein
VPDLNILNIAGRLGRDVKLADVNGKPVANFAVAVDVGYGQRKHTVWVDCAYWGNGAQAVAPYLTKGRSVAVAGEFDLEEFSRQDGSKDKKIRCQVSKLTLMGDGGQQPAAQPVASPPPAAPKAPDVFDDEIPF